MVSFNSGPSVRLEEYKGSPAHMSGSLKFEPMKLSYEPNLILLKKPPRSQERGRAFRNDDFFTGNRILSLTLDDNRFKVEGIVQSIFRPVHR